MTLHQILIEVLARAVDNNVNVYMKDAYKIQAKRLQMLITIKGPNYLASDVSIEEANDVKVINVYA